LGGQAAASAPAKSSFRPDIPEHEIIRLAASGDYRAFYAHEIELRRALGYPPFTRLILLHVEHRLEAQALQHAHALKKRLEELKIAEVLGPARALPYRLHGNYRWQLLLKSTEESIQRAIWEALTELKLADSVTVNVDPQL
jgi:primosomal protein N' (replication factor Y)